MEDTISIKICNIILGFLKSWSLTSGAAVDDHSQPGLFGLRWSCCCLIDSKIAFGFVEAQVRARALTLNLLSSIPLHTTPRVPKLGFIIPSQNPSKKTPHLFLAVTSAHRALSALHLDATPVPLEEEDNEKKSAWKYPFSDVEVKKRRTLFGREWSTRDAARASAYVAVHALCLFAPFTFTWAAFKVGTTLAVFTGLGITLSYHRNLAHRSFKLPKWLEYFWAYCGVHALQGTPMTWVNLHRVHHLYTDKERDPYSPIEGFWFSHINWFFDTKYFNTKEGGELTYVEDMKEQPFYRFIEETYIAHPIALVALLYIVGGFPWLVWGMEINLKLSYVGAIGWWSPLIHLPRHFYKLGLYPRFELQPLPISILPLPLELPLALLPIPSFLLKTLLQFLLIFLKSGKLLLNRDVSGHRL
ncbi:hypothetical protein LguiB_031753 [Lonicera macranthoides]